MENSVIVPTKLFDSILNWPVKWTVVNNDPGGTADSKVNLFIC
jgi:hypothetical protein